MIFICCFYFITTLISGDLQYQNFEQIEFTKKPYFFDAGDKSSNFADNHFLISPDVIYQEENGYGWLTENLNPFSRDEWMKSRDDFLIDGISDERIEFRADLPEGEWWITIWFEAGMEDSSSVNIFANGENITPELQAFNPGAEPRNRIQKIYRVIQQKVVLDDIGLTLSFVGEKDIVRLLGFAFIPVSESDSKSEAAGFFKKIKIAGEFDSKEKLLPLIEQLDQLADNEEHQNFTAYWKLQLEILQKAEAYFYYRGWSKHINETGLGLFDHLHQSVMLYDGLLNYPEAEKNPLYERALWYRGRLLYWLWLERGIHFEKEAAERDLAMMFELHPENELVRMYNGERIEYKAPFDDIKKPANAPKWALSQWEVSNRLKHIADWWVLEQQSETGEFGGKFGDDVELLRFWSPLILSGDSIVYHGWKKLADGVWNSHRIYKGYAKSPSDVEHSSEFISDTAPLMILYTDDSEYEKRLSYSAGYFRNLWTGYNDYGRRFFKSSWFSSTEIEIEPPKNRDVPYTTRAVKAVRFYVWKNQHEETLKALEEWTDAWLHVSQRTEKGKPKGILPASVEFPTEEFNGKEDNWYTANMYWDYYDWSGDTGAAMLDQFLFTWTLTGKEKYLKPLFQHLELVNRYSDRLFADEIVMNSDGFLGSKWMSIHQSFRNAENPYPKGTEIWTAFEIGNSEEFWNIVETWRLLSGDPRYDELILEHSTPYLKYRLTGNEHFLVEGIQPYLETIRYNYPMFTSEAIHTDRVHIGPNRAREIEILQAMVTGYGIKESASPYIAVSWEDASRDLTYLVNQSTPSKLSVDLYSFSDSMEEVTLRLWQLSKGEYDLEIHEDNGLVKSQRISVDQRGDRFNITIPPKIPVKLFIN